MTIPKRNPYVESSMRLTRASRRHSPAGLCGLLVLLLLAGCARPPWSELVDEQRTADFSARYSALQEQNRSCSDSLDGEVRIDWRSSFDNVALAGYFRLRSPSLLQLTVFNPLGQPLLAVSADSTQYQILRVPERRFLSGSLRSFSVRYGLPEPFLSGAWFDWLTGRPRTGAIVSGVRQDNSSRGLWLALAEPDNQSLPLEHVLLDPEGRQILERIVVDREDRRQATISYDDWQEISGCRQPTVISITGLSFGTEAQLRFSEVRPAEFKDTDFILPIPPGFTRTVMP